MTGFSAAWLALRDGADRRARSARLEQAAAEALGTIPTPCIADLGAGTGATLLALAPRFGPSQHWVLIDHDPALADAAHARLSAQARGARMEGGDLLLDLDGRFIRVTFAARDLAADPGAALAFGPNLVTASAFFDLVSAQWCQAFTAALAQAGVMLSAALTCDGNDQWQPPHPSDGAIAAAFRRHQGRDKGFGPAAGPEAGAVLAAALAAQGYEVRTEESPWLLGPDDRTLMATLAEGTAMAAQETGEVPPEAVTSWEAARKTASACRIGHVDLFARPRA